MVKMMEQELLSMMLQGGTNAIFAAFLFWQNREQKKGFDDRESKLESRENEMIGRYEKKLDEQQIREDAARSSLISDVNDLEKRVVVFEIKLEAIIQSLQELKTMFSQQSNK
tara:strand:- start:1364 stop:1699 length:336 start_codon:yes stop_codon:yes gene_type:complete